MNTNEVVAPDLLEADNGQNRWKSHLSKLWRTFSKNKLLRIEPMLVLFMFGSFFYVPLFQQYYFVRFGSGLLQNTSFHRPNKSFCLNSSQIDRYFGKDGHKIVETYSNNLVLYGQLASRIPAMITVLILGPLSDHFGRKILLVSSTVGTLLQSIVALVIVGFHLSPYLFILASFLTGICGDFTGLIAGSFSYIADVSSPKWRAFTIGVTEGVFAIGGAAGQFLSGYWLSDNNCNFLPLMCLEVACCIATLLWIIFLIPESLSQEERLKRVAEKPKGVKLALNGLKMFLGRVPKYSAWKLWAVVAIIVLPMVNSTGNVLLSVYFLKAPPFDADSKVIGIFQALESVSQAVSVTFVIFSFSVALGLPDIVIALVGVSFQAAGNILMGFAHAAIQVYIIAIVQGIEAISWTAGRSLLSKQVANEDQGALFSVAASIQSCTSLLSSVLWPLLYPLTLKADNLPTGFIYLTMAMLDVLVFPVIIVLASAEYFQRYQRPLKNKGQNETDKLLTRDTDADKESNQLDSEC